MVVYGKKKKQRLLIFQQLKRPTNGQFTTGETTTLPEAFTCRDARRASLQVNATIRYNLHSYIHTFSVTQTAPDTIRSIFLSCRSVPGAYPAQ